MFTLIPINVFCVTLGLYRNGEWVPVHILRAKLSYASEAERDSYVYDQSKMNTNLKVPTANVPHCFPLYYVI